MPRRETNPVFERLRSFGIRPKHYLGQNFLIDEQVYDEIIRVAEISDKTNVIEIGTGLGTLTEALALHAQHVVTIENDLSLVKKLPRLLDAHANITLVPGNVLSIPTAELYRLFPNTSDVKVVANIPYYITGKIIRKFLDTTPKPRELILMVQREVAERLTAKPGGMSMLSLTSQALADAEICFQVPASSFYPEPKIQSAVIKLTPTELPKELQEIDLEKLFRTAKMCFAHRRKKLSNSLAGGLHKKNNQAEELLQKAKIDGGVRPQDLSISDWARLVKVLNS